MFIKTGFYSENIKNMIILKNDNLIILKYQHFIHE